MLRSYISRQRRNARENTRPDPGGVRPQGGEALPTGNGIEGTKVVGKGPGVPYYISRRAGDWRSAGSHRLWEKTTQTQAQAPTPLCLIEPAYHDDHESYLKSDWLYDFTDEIGWGGFLIPLPPGPVMFIKGGLTYLTGATVPKTLVWTLWYPFSQTPRLYVSGCPIHIQRTRGLTPPGRNVCGVRERNHRPPLVHCCMWCP